MRLKYGDVPKFRGLTLETDTVVRKTWIVSEEDYALEIGKLVNFLIRHPDPMIVPVYDWQYFGPEAHGYKYSYSMMRMCQLSSDEKSIIDAASDRPGLFQADYKQACLEELPGFDIKPYSQLVNFLITVLKEEKYWDLHSGNVMLDLDENYRLIDLEGFVSTNVKGSHNDWFKKD